MIADYVATGKVRFEFRDDAFLGPESTRAAEAAACALDQKQFWPYHDALFANQGEENAGAFGDDRLRALARAVGLDGDAFDRCLDGQTHAADVAAMAAEAAQNGIGSTPTFVVNGQVIQGFPGYDALAATIESALKGTG